MNSGFAYAVGIRFLENKIRISFPGPIINSGTKFVNEVFLHVRVYPLCELQRRNNHWSNIHKNCTADGKYESEPCKVCGVGEYEEKTCGETENTVCKPCKKCSLGSEYILSPCTSASDAVCTKCTEFCGINQYIQQNCTQENDTVCGTCAEKCGDGLYVTDKCTNTTDLICGECTTCCEEGQFIKRNCSPTKDAICAKCNVCPLNFYSSGGCNGTHDTSCTLCGPLCSEGFYELQECNATHPRICDVCSPECSEGFYELQECNATHPRICDVCSPECSEGFYELQECNTTHPRICAQCTDCKHPMSFVNTPCSNHGNTVCSSFESNISGSKKKEQPYDLSFIIIIGSGILSVVSIVVIAGYVYRKRRKSARDETDIYADPRTCTMTKNLSYSDRKPFQGKENKYNDIDEIQYDFSDSANVTSSYASINIQDPKRLTENGNAYASLNKNESPTFETEESEYSALNIIPEKSEYSALSVESAYAALSTNCPKEREYSKLNDETAAEGEYSTLDDNDCLYSSLKTGDPKLYCSSFDQCVNYMDIHIYEKGTEFYSGVERERVDYASIDLNTCKKDI